MNLLIPFESFKWLFMFEMEHNFLLDANRIKSNFSRIKNNTGGIILSTNTVYLYIGKSCVPNPRFFIIAMERNSTTTSQTNQIGARVATNSRDEFLKDLRFKFNGPNYQQLLDELFRSFVVTDQFCEKEEPERLDAVFHLYQLKDILLELESVLDQMGKEVSHG